MGSSILIPRPTPPRFTFAPLWTFGTAAAPRGLALAREQGTVLAWDEENWLYLLDRAGRRQAQVPASGPVTAACAADDGSAYAAADARGEVSLLAPDLLPRWRYTLSQRAVALALDPFGQYLAVSDTAGRLSLFTRQGRPVWRVQSPRPLCNLAFVPEAQLLLGSADLGLVCAFDMAGACRWRDGLVVHVGGLAVNGTGDRIALACFSEGLHCYSLDGQKRGRLATPEPCRLVSMSYDGGRFLVSGLGSRIGLLDEGGRSLGEQVLDRPCTAMTLTALAEMAIVALPDGRVCGLGLQAPPMPSASPG